MNDIALVVGHTIIFIAGLAGIVAGICFLVKFIFIPIVDSFFK